MSFKTNALFVPALVRSNDVDVPSPDPSVNDISLPVVVVIVLPAS